MDAAAISALDDPAFRELITDNIHPADDTAEVWETLLSPDLLKRSAEMLLNLRRDVERTLGRKRRELEDFRAECFLRGAAGKQEWFAGKAEYEDWKRRANSFRYMVEARQAQLRPRLKGTNEAVAKAQDGDRRALAKLSRAVQRHQADHAKSGSRTEQCDHDLWRALDELTVLFTDGRTASLRNMLTTFWTDSNADNGAASRAAERLMQDAPAGRAARFEGAPRARHVGGDKPLTA